MNELQASLPFDLPTQSVPVRRIVGRNPGPMTGPGTNSYLIGKNSLCLVDPGPRDAIQLATFLQAIGDAELKYILVTHTHLDHSPGCKELQAATGAELVGIQAPDMPGHDRDFAPQQIWQDGDTIETGEYSIQLVHTPGHVSNHFCYLLLEEGVLFTGDHVLEGTTPVILPPDGNMADYLNALERLQRLALRSLAPGHGLLMLEPMREIQQLIDHRLQREAKILKGLRSLKACDEATLVQTVYDDVDPALIPWALKTQLAHLLKLRAEGIVEQRGEIWRIASPHQGSHGG